MLRGPAPSESYGNSSNYQSESNYPPRNNSSRSPQTSQNNYAFGNSGVPSANRAMSTAPRSQGNGYQVLPGMNTAPPTEDELGRGTVKIPEDDWEQHTTDDGQVYYWNRVTNESSWEMPN